MDDGRVFKALADPSRRHLLDRLFERDGQTLMELAAEVDMTRFGVMKHLRVLEGAGLILTRRAGREKHHYLNAVPIQLIHDRWIGKYRERHAAALTELKAALEENRDDNDRNTRDGDSGVSRIHQGDTAGDLGRHHKTRVDTKVRLRSPRRVRRAARR